MSADTPTHLDIDLCALEAIARHEGHARLGDWLREHPDESVDEASERFRLDARRELGLPDEKRKP